MRQMSQSTKQSTVKNKRLPNSFEKHFEKYSSTVFSKHISACKS